MPRTSAIVRMSPRAATACLRVSAGLPACQPVPSKASLAYPVSASTLVSVVLLSTVLLVAVLPLPYMHAPYI